MMYRMYIITGSANTALANSGKLAGFLKHRSGVSCTNYTTESCRRGILIYISCIEPLRTLSPI